MALGRNGLILMIALLALLAGALAASACGGGSKAKATPAATSPAATPKTTTQATQAAATPKATQAAATPAVGATSVDIKDFQFNPSKVTIKVGGTVTWTNSGPSTHTVTGDGGIDSGDLSKGKSYSKTFDTAGTFNYHCSIHPSMTGQVIVQQSGPAPASPGY
jgi:plastocyanin